MLHVTEAVMAERTDWIFLYGGNVEGTGFGGQAAVMRGKPNAIEVPTKWRPSMEEGSFFRDADFADTALRALITDPFRRARRGLAAGRTLVIPARGLGTGMAELRVRAPLIYGYIGGWITALEDMANGGEEDQDG